MGRLTEAEIGRLVGAVSPLLMHELLRSGACLGELRRAIAIAAASHGPERRLSPRMRRLVDLVGTIEGLVRAA